jgi:predicted enzyme related to lactoylglutathione lyase
VAVLKRRRSGVGSSLALAIAVGTLLAGCAATLPQVPPLDSTGIVLPGKVVWRDLVTPDINQAKAFYGGLLGWTFEDLSSGYSLASHNGRYVAGIARLGRNGRAGHWLPLVSVLDIDAVVSQAADGGGKTVLRPFEMADRGRIAVIKDPQGAAFGIVHSRHGDPADREPDINGWLWNEIWTDDLPGAIKFYTTVGGYQLAERTIAEIPYQYFERDGQPRVGLLEKPSPEIGNTWVAYIRVAEVSATVDKATALGGTVLMAPSAAVRNATVAVIADPGGAGFVIQEWRRQQ